MKLGIIGGIGPESTIDYYRLIINAYQEIKKDGNYPELIIKSVNMKKMLDMVENQAWDHLTAYLSEAVNSVFNGGAQYAIIASNTPHVVFEEIQVLSPVPILSIVEEACKKAKDMGLKKVGLFGTRFTMQSDFYQKVFAQAGITMLVPKPDEQDYIHDKIFSELEMLKIYDDTKKGLLSIAKRMIDEQEIEGLVLGCTELPLILTHDEFGIPFLNTSKIHVESAVNYAMLGTKR